MVVVTCHLRLSVHQEKSDVMTLSFLLSTARKNVFILPFLFIFGLASCEKEVVKEQVSPKPMVDYVVSFKASSDTVRMGESKPIVPTFTPDIFYPGQKFEYRIQDSSIVDLKISSDYSAQVIAKEPGKTDIRFYTTSSVGEKQLSTVSIVVLEKIPDAPMATVQINFGTGSAAGWNTFPGFTAGSTLQNASDMNGKASGLSFVIEEGFNAINTAGPASTTTALNIPPEVSKDSYFGNSFAVYEGQLVKQSVLKLEGLDMSKKYEFVFFGSRMSASDNRETKFTVSGQNTAADSINTASNSTRVATISNITPTEGGKATITITAGGNNNNSSGFYYVTAMIVKLVE